MKKRTNMQTILALTAVSTLITSWTDAVSARNNYNNQPQEAPQRQDQDRAMQEAQRAQQEQQQRAFQQQLQQQQEARRNQEQQMRGQEEQARRDQEQAIRSQQEAAQRQQQEMQRHQQEAARNQERQQEQLQRQQQQQESQRQQQEALRHQERQQEQLQRQQQNEMRQQQEAQRLQQESGRNQERQPEQLQQRQRNDMRQQQEAERQQQVNQERMMQTHEREQKREARNTWRNGQDERTAFGGPDAPVIHGLPGRFNPGLGIRPLNPHPFNMPNVKIDKAHSMPVLEENLSAEEREHANLVNENLARHLYAVEASQAPQSSGDVRNYWHNTYFHNYPISWNNQTAYLTPQNCFVNIAQPNQWPYWYNPEPGWQYCNGFSLGNFANVAASWLGFGWHPYYGQQPEGFVCATDYFPTLWTYVPAYGLWRVAGEPGWAPSGPPYDYTGPISVEVWEPRHVNVRDPYTGWNTKRVVNVIYMYNAFFYPEMERWGYTNRHGYFMWLNL